MNHTDIKFPDGTRFLVTGGAGFIGSNLCEAILDMGQRVRCLDNFSNGKRENIAGFLANPLFELLEGDIRDLDTCLNACDGIDYVLHEAAWGSVPRSIEHPLLYEEINIRGMLNMIEAARQKGVSRFVYASSSSVYGDEPNLPKREGREGKPLSPYALTKRTAEKYCRLYWDLYGLETISLRYFNVFGRRQDPDGPYAAAIPRFIRAMANGQTPVINGDGSQSRDFTYVDNVVQANLKACLAGKDAVGQVFNIAYGEKVTLLALFQAIAKALGREDIQPVFGSWRKGDVHHSHADIGKAVRLLGYAPEWDFERGIKETIRWYRENQ